MSNQISQDQQSEHWSTLKESGTFKGILFLLFVYRIFGRTIFSIVLYPVMAYFFIFKPLARSSSKQYLELHYQYFPEKWKKRPGYSDVFKHLYAFGQAILDKLLAWTNPISEEEFELADESVVEKFRSKEAGQLIIGSHIGNLEYCRGFMQRYKNKVINALVYDHHSANFINAMQSLNPESRINIYQVDALDIPEILKLKTKIDAGEWLFIAGDRVPLSGEQRTVEVSFLGKSANLPIGPYMLAKLLQCEVHLMFSYRKADKRVHFEVVPFAEKLVLPRKNADEGLKHYAQIFAREMEKQLVHAPYQWDKS
jgi:predicted LPLAT superfamily acyltransferase